MLSHLRIENYALIQNLSIDFNRGFSVITGETGAGKSILLGALSLILGQRADTFVLFDKSKKCYVECIFSIQNYGLQDFFEKNNLDYDDSALLRREINPAGKSRAFINDTPVNLNLLKEIGDKLVDIHSQHKTIALNDFSFQLALVDGFAGNQQIIKEYKSEYSIYSSKNNKLKEMLEREQQLKSDQNYYQFLVDELEEVNLQNENEQEELEAELKILTNSESIKSNLFLVNVGLSESDNSLLNRLSELISLLDPLLNIHDDIKNISERLKSCQIELKDITSEIDHLQNKIIYDPLKIEAISNRLDSIYRLEQKHRVTTIIELIHLKNSFTDKLSAISSIDKQISELQLDIQLQKEVLIKLSQQISENRKNTFSEIEKELLKVLSQVGMPNAQFKIEHSMTKDLTNDGIDIIRFLFNANRGGQVSEISRIASGGELSRLMLGLKSLITQRNLLPTVIFDEIDMGVSGDIAGKVGNILQKMSNNMQVIAITHLPQIAGKSSSHYFVYKETKGNTTTSFIKLLNQKERITEIAKMLSNETVTNAAVETAKELLNY